MPRKRHTVTVLRLCGSFANDIETDAINGVGSIPGVVDVTIEAGDADSVTLSYEWIGSEDFDRTDEHLANYGLRKRWKDEGPSSI
jgi:hypothetical protein